MARDRKQLVITLSLLTLFGAGIVTVFGEDLRALFSGPALRSGEGPAPKTPAGAKTGPGPTAVP